MRVDVKPELLLWASERAGRSIDVLAQQQSFRKLPSWISGEERPTFKQLEKVAQATYTPFGFFSFQSLPKNLFPFPTFGRPVTNIWAAKVRIWREAVGELRRAIEQLNIMAIINGIVGNNTHRKLDVEEFRGFALSDDYAPLVFVNGADAKSAQMFTLIHELAHIWLGESALTDAGPATRASQKIESWCDRAAAEFLVQWVKNDLPAGFFIGTDDLTAISAYEEIMLWVQRNSQYFDQAKAKFATEADGWLAAYVMAYDATIVTNEQPRPQSRNCVLLSDVCAQFNITSKDTFFMLKDLAIRFEWKDVS